MAAEKGNRELSKVCLAYDIVSPQVLERAFCRAVETGNLAAIGTFLRRGADPNVGIAAFQGKIDSFKMNVSLQADIIYLLVQAGAQLSDEIALSVQRSFTLEERDSEDDIRLLRVLLQLGYNKAWVRQCLLTSYAEENSMFDCDACIDGGALINGRDINGESALQTAAYYDCLFLVQHLISRGADPNLPLSRNHPKVQSALYSALARGHWEVAAYLIDSGADITAKATTTGATLLEGVLFTPCMGNGPGHLETIIKKQIRDLLALGAPVRRPNGTDSFLPHGLVLLGELDCLELALKAGVQVEGKYGGMTPIQLAVLQKDTDIIQSLLQHGANINGCPGSLCNHTTLSEMPSPSPPLFHGAHRFEEIPKKQIFRRALSSGFQMGVFADEKPYFPHSPLQLASSCHDPDLDLVEFLLSQGADFNAPAAAWYGRTALQGAASARNASMEVVKLLLDRGANVNEPPAQVGGVTALQGATIRGDMQLVRLLLSRGANINAPGSPIEGRTALEGAAEHGRIEMLRYLLSKGAMPDPVTGYARAIELAKKELHFGIANFLRDEQRKLDEMGFLGIDLDSL
ncbi:Clr5 domain-containing protein [Fusarium sp. LHS14.1]|nr:Clr5 domain-containing protein [Fusarium sp. LHS14.1]